MANGILNLTLSGNTFIRSPLKLEVLNLSLKDESQKDNYTLRETGRAEEALCEEAYLCVLVDITVRVEKVPTLS